MAALRQTMDRALPTWAQEWAPTSILSRVGTRMRSLLVSTSIRNASVVETRSSPNCPQEIADWRLLTFIVSIRNTTAILTEWCPSRRCLGFPISGKRLRRLQNLALGGLRPRHYFMTGRLIAL